MQGGESHLVYWDSRCHQVARNCGQTSTLSQTGICYITFSSTTKTRHDDLSREAAFVGQHHPVTPAWSGLMQPAAVLHKEIMGGWKSPWEGAGGEASVKHPSSVHSPRNVSFLKMFSSTNVNRGDPAPSLSSSLVTAAPSALPCSGEKNQ